MRLYYSDHYTIPLPPGHRFPVAKYGLLRAALQETGRFEFVPAPLADAETIELIHDREYVREFIAGTLPKDVMRRIGFPWSEGLVSRTLASVGSTVAAAHDALQSGCGGGLAGGTHHAFRAEGFRGGTRGGRLPGAGFPRRRVPVEAGAGRPSRRAHTRLSIVRLSDRPTV